MTFTKEQLSELMCKHAERENGLHDLMEIMLESPGSHRIRALLLCFMTMLYIHATKAPLWNGKIENFLFSRIDICSFPVDIVTLYERRDFGLLF